MAKLARRAEINGVIFNVPQFVNRTVSGWQVRVRGVPSQHFADAYYGSTQKAMEAAAAVVAGMLKAREDFKPPF